MSIKSKEQNLLEQHILSTIETTKSYNKFHWFLSVFSKVRGLFKNETDFMEYKTREKSVRRYAEDDRQFPLDNTVIHSVTDNNENFEEATIHTGSYADEFTRSMHALAITIGNDIYFRNGVYKPETEEGRVVLAHELTHVSQNEDKEELRNQSKEELENAASLNEQKEIYDSDPIITKKIDGKEYSYKKSIWNKIRTKALKEIETEIESKEKILTEEEYMNLLIRYNEWLDKEALSWLK